uniref:PGG domain-containing protein n=1 Tax=Nelumbo nucifera TaxID=4432 RepID=A0A822XUF7_NELNU|nr:TPA_asm: hypothetical protein HUJ06_023908 [Nelumbo nucifera]
MVELVLHPHITNYTWCQEFYNNIVIGKYEQVKEFLDKNKGIVSSRITVGYDLPLHIAARAGQLKIVNLLLDNMTEEVMTVNKDLKTALHLAASAGHLDVIEALVKKQDRLLLVQAYFETPLVLAIRNQQKKVVKFLYDITCKMDKDESNWRNSNSDEHNLYRATVLTSLIHGRFFNLAYKLLKSFPDLVLTKDIRGQTAVTALIETTFENQTWWSAFSMLLSAGIEDIKSRFSFRRRKQDVENVDNPQADAFVPRPLKSATDKNQIRLMSVDAFNLLRLICQQIATLKIIDADDEEDNNRDKELTKSITDALFLAVKKGNVDFVAEILRYCPRLARLLNEEDMNLFHASILHRQDKIFQLIDDLDVPTNTIDAYWDKKTHNNTLHLVATLPPVERLNQISGAALQARKELIWFMKVQAILPHARQEENNKEKKTPRMLFDEMHDGLFKQGEEWMKRTADACMVVAVLVASAMLSATLQLPGAARNDTGITIFISEHEYFNSFIISNMISLLFSSASVIAFLSIYISRFSQRDFLEALPRMLSIGLLFLYISIAAMMTNFVSTILMVLRNEIKWAMAPPAFLSMFPIFVISLRQLPLLFEMMHSTYSLTIFTESTKHLNI